MSSKIVLITGCSTGIGHDLARRLTLANYTVIATARHPEKLADLQVALQLPLDVTDPTSIASATEEVVRRFGRLDILVNNAGYAVRGAVEDISVEQVQKGRHRSESRSQAGASRSGSQRAIVTLRYSAGPVADRSRVTHPLPRSFLRIVVLKNATSRGNGYGDGH